MTDTKELKAQMVKLTERVILLQQALSVAMRTEPSGTTTVGSLDNASAAQLDDNPLFYIEHADGGLNVYLSQIVAQAQKDIDAKSITSGTLNTGRLPVIPIAKVPAAVNSATAGVGFGGFRYTVSGTTLNLFTS